MTKGTWLLCHLIFATQSNRKSWTVDLNYYILKSTKKYNYFNYSGSTISRTANNCGTYNMVENYEVVNFFLNNC